MMQPYRTSLPFRDLENLRLMDFCSTECTYTMQLLRKHSYLNLRHLFITWEIILPSRWRAVSPPGGVTQNGGQCEPENQNLYEVLICRGLVIKCIGRGNVLLGRGGAHRGKRGKRRAARESVCSSYCTRFERPIRITEGTFQVSDVG